MDDENEKREILLQCCDMIISSTEYITSVTRLCRSEVMRAENKEAMETGALSIFTNVLAKGLSMFCSHSQLYMENLKRKYIFNGLSTYDTVLQHIKIDKANKRKIEEPIQHTAKERPIKQENITAEKSDVSMKPMTGEIIVIEDDLPNGGIETVDKQDTPTNISKEGPLNHENVTTEVCDTSIEIVQAPADEIIAIVHDSPNEECISENVELITEEGVVETEVFIVTTEDDSNNEAGTDEVDNFKCETTVVEILDISAELVRIRALDQEFLRQQSEQDDELFQNNHSAEFPASNDSVQINEDVVDLTSSPGSDIYDYLKSEIDIIEHDIKTENNITLSPTRNNDNISADVPNLLSQYNGAGGNNNSGEDADIPDISLLLDQNSIELLPVHENADDTELPLATINGPEHMDNEKETTKPVRRRSEKNIQNCIGCLAATKSPFTRSSSKKRIVGGKNLKTPKKPKFQ